MAVTQRQLAASIRACIHIADRDAVAGFLVAAATEPSLNPFPETTAGAQRHIWTGQNFEFRSFQIESLGLECLLKALAHLPGNEPLVHESFRMGAFRGHVYHHGDGCRIAGCVVHGRAMMALPTLEWLPRRRVPRRPISAPLRQLDLFAFAQPVYSQNLISLTV